MSFLFLGKKRRKRRWGDESDKVDVYGTSPACNSGSHHSDQLVQYAIRVFGSTDLSESQWKQCEDQMKVKM